MILRQAAMRLATACLLAVGGVCAASAQELGGRCIECHSQVAIVLLPVQFSDGQECSPFIEKESFLQSAHGELGCAACHRESHPELQPDFVPSEDPSRKLPTRAQYKEAIYRECKRCHSAGGDAEEKTISEVLHPTGCDETPSCGDCHPPHAMRREASGSIAIDRRCADCHQDLYLQFAASVHSQGMGDMANPDLPSCTSCHSGHVGGGKSPAAQRIRLGRPCMGCHGDEPLMQKYGLSTSVVSTYLNDFHGVTVNFYGDDSSDTQRFVLVCADCHGVHGVKPASGESAAAMKASLGGTCRKCHPDATDAFAAAWLSHSEPSLSANLPVYLVKIAYWILVPFVITGLLLHIIFHLVVLPIRNRMAAKRTKGNQLPGLHAPGIAQRTPAYVPAFFVRFSLRQRVEHLIVIVTFGILVVTGLPQKFHDHAWTVDLVRLLGGIDTLREVHRIAAYTFTGVAAFHFLVVGALVVLRRAPMTMLPERKDFYDAIGSLKYYLGLADKYPKAGRFDYGQKFEYWGMALGSIVMVVSGFLLIFPAFSARFLPGQLIAAARVAHSYEAMMALLTIVVWHMYGFRFDTSIFTGKISRERLAHHHPLEYERLVGLIAKPKKEDVRVASPATAEAEKKANNVPVSSPILQSELCD